MIGRQHEIISIFDSESACTERLLECNVIFIDIEIGKSDRRDDAVDDDRVFAVAGGDRRIRAEHVDPIVEIGCRNIPIGSGRNRLPADIAPRGVLMIGSDGADRNVIGGGGRFESGNVIFLPAFQNIIGVDDKDAGRVRRRKIDRRLGIGKRRIIRLRLGRVFTGSAQQFRDRVRDAAVVDSVIENVGNRFVRENHRDLRRRECEIAVQRQRRQRSGGDVSLKGHGVIGGIESDKSNGRDAAADRDGIVAGAAAHGIVVASDDDAIRRCARID